MPARFDYEKYKPVLLDSTGRRLTVGLFVEWADPASPNKPVFYLSEWRKAYVAVSDPTGYKACEQLLGDWEHWLLLMANQRFAAEVEEWNKEVEVKLTSEAIANVRMQAADPKGTAAAKWLATQGYTQKKAAKKEQGPSSAEEREERRFILKDAERIGVGR